MHVVPPHCERVVSMPDLDRPLPHDPRLDPVRGPWSHPWVAHSHGSPTHAYSPPLFMQTYICGKGPVPLPQPTAAIFRSPCRQPPFHPPDRHSWEGSAAPADRQSWEGSPLPWPPLISTGSPSTHLHLRMHLPLRIFECTPCCYTPAMLLHPCHVVPVLFMNRMNCICILWILSMHMHA